LIPCSFNNRYSGIIDVNSINVKQHNQRSILNYLLKWRKTNRKIHEIPSRTLRDQHYIKEQ